MKVASFGLIKHGFGMAMIVFSLVSAVRSAVPNNPFLGIPPQDESYYKVSSDTIKCKDGSGTFTKLQLNDDFCDCPDATDEPGTSACPSGRFYCRNAGHTPLFLASSRVNDGLCDCCDGSDEYDGTVKCSNTCWEAGKVARDKLRKKIATYKEGVALRKKDVEQAKVVFAKDEAELSKLKNEEKILKDLVQQLKEQKEQIEKAEEKERLQKEKEEKERKEAEERVNKENSQTEAKYEQQTGKTDEKIDHEDKPMESAHDHIGVMEDSSADQDIKEEDVDLADHSYASESIETPVDSADQLTEATEEKSTSSESKDETNVASEAILDHGNKESSQSDKKVEDDVSENTEGMSREELGRLVASRWTGSSDKQTDEVDDTKDNDHAESEDHEDSEDHEEIPPDTHDDEYDTYASDSDDDSGKYDEIEDDVEEEKYEEENHDDTSSSYKPESDDELDFSETSSPSSLSWLEKIQKTARSILQAVNLFQTPVDKSEAARIRKEYEESNSKLSKMQSRISSLTSKLKHDFGSEKEFYSFYDHCFEGKENKYVYKVCPFKHASQMEGHSTTRLGRWDKFEESYRVMVFSNGDKCWNGPDRSLKVKLRCGLKNEVTDVDEPSRCEYVALLSTPALCLEEKLKELEDKLEMMNKEEPEKHDEL